MTDAIPSDEESYANESFEKDTDTDLPPCYNETDETDSVSDEGASLPSQKILENISHYTKSGFHKRTTDQKNNLEPYDSSSEEENEVVIGNTIVEINTEPMDLDSLNLRSPNVSAESIFKWGQTQSITTIRKTVPNFVDQPDSTSEVDDEFVDCSNEEFSANEGQGDGESDGKDNNEDKVKDDIEDGEDDEDGDEDEDGDDDEDDDEDGNDDEDEEDTQRIQTAIVKSNEMLPKKSESETESEEQYKSLPDAEMSAQADQHPDCSDCPTSNSHNRALSTDTKNNFVLREAQAAVISNPSKLRMSLASIRSRFSINSIRASLSAPTLKSQPSAASIRSRLPTTTNKSEVALVSNRPRASGASKINLYESKLERIGDNNVAYGDPAILSTTYQLTPPLEEDEKLIYREHNQKNPQLEQNFGQNVLSFDNTLSEYDQVNHCDVTQSSGAVEQQDHRLEPQVEVIINSQTPTSLNTEEYEFHMNFIKRNMTMSSEKSRLKAAHRKSWSFTNARVREIERQNHILLRKILTQKPTYVMSPKKSNHKFSNLPPTTKVTNAAVNRKKQQRQIDLDNDVLKRRIEAISLRRPVF